MTSPKPTAPPPLPDDLLALIRDANDVDPQALVDDALSQAAWSRIEAAVGPSAAATTMGGAAWGLTSKVVVGLVCAVVVGALGAVVVAHGAGTDPTPASSTPTAAPATGEVPGSSGVSSALSSSSSSSPPSSASSSAPSSTAPTWSPPSSSTPRPPPSMSSSSSVKISRETTSENERALIEQARDALAASRFVDVDAALSRHRARHADGVLAEDRDALTVLSLLKQGQIDHARAAARRFDERFPESLYRPRIQAAFASITPSSP